MAITLTAKQKQRIDTASNWTTANPTLLTGELGIESDTGKTKVGDGSTAWSSLAYTTFGGLPTTGGTMTGAILGDDSTSASTPGYAFDGDANTGLLRTAADAVALVTGGTAAVSVDSSQNVILAANLTVNGTTTTIDTQNLDVEDKNITIGKVSTPSDTTADGGGITLKGASDKTIAWTNSTDSWDFNQHVNIATGTEFKINNVSVLSATTLGGAVVNSSLTTLGTIATGVWQGTAVGSSYMTAGTTSAVGAVQLEDSTTSTSTTKAATPASVKVAKDAADAAATTANAAVAKAGDTMTGNIVLDNDKELRFNEADSNGSAYVGIKGQTDKGSEASYTISLPAAAPTANQILKADASTPTTLAWATDSATDSSKLPLTGGTLVGDLLLDNQKDLRFGEPDGAGTEYVAFQAPDTIASSIIWKLPNADSTVNGYALVSDGSGNLSWAAAGGGAKGSSGEEIFWENEKQMDNDYTISGSGAKNAGVFGPLTLAATLTVPSGCTLTIV